jgi:hypothetical protein
VLGSSAGGPCTGGVCANPNGAFAVVPKGAFEVVPNGAFAVAPNGAFAVAPNGAFAVVPNGAFAVVPNGAFAVAPNGAFAVVPNGVFEVVPNGVFEVVPNGVFEVVPNGVFEVVPNGVFEVVPNGVFEVVPNGALEDVPKGVLIAVPKGVFEDVPYALGRAGAAAESNLAAGKLPELLSICDVEAKADVLGGKSWAALALAANGGLFFRLAEASVCNAAGVGAARLGGAPASCARPPPLCMKKHLEPCCVPSKKHHVVFVHVCLQTRHGQHEHVRSTSQRIL